MINSTPSKRSRRGLWGFAAVVLVLVVGFAIGEWLGWPFLAAPLANSLSDKLAREVRFTDQPANTTDKVSTHTPFRMRFLGGLYLQAAHMSIAAPAWSKAPHTLLGQQMIAEFRYIDLWRAYRGLGLNIQRLQADKLDVHLERLANGNATWQISTNTKPQSSPLPTFGHLQVKLGTLVYQDALLQADIKSQFSFAMPPLATLASRAQTKNYPANTTNAVGKSKPSSMPSWFNMQATGTYKKMPLKLTLLSTGTLPTALNKSAQLPVDITLNGSLGRATIAFKGSAPNALQPSNFTGNFKLKGPSLAALGDLVGVTLPTTAAFSSQGYVDKQQKTWRITLKRLAIGASQLHGKFFYDKRRSTPLLSGQLNGSKFLITDLGPAFGALDTQNNPQKVLPKRPFDLKSLRVMQADIQINLQHVDLNTQRLAPLKPLRGHLKLVDGVLTIQDLDARTAQGTLMGDLTLDGRGKIALWQAKLRWTGVQLAQWVRQVRENGEVPYIAGKLSGKATLSGQGVSSADMLATLTGSIQSELQSGAISHLVVEAAGLDLAQSLGVLFKGDDALPLQCAVADLVAENGVLRPKVVVLDTADSALWLNGNLSLAKETIDLKLVVMPKDFSPLSLRSPLHVHGTFANPQTSLEKGKIGMKLAGAALLSLLNPLAGIIPLLDSGNADEAKRHSAHCNALMQYSPAKANKPIKPKT